MALSDNSNNLRGHSDHPRRFQAYELVYPVLSRRSKGISLGVNLNLDQSCNFRCVYCQVDQSEHRSNDLFSLDRLQKELRGMLLMLQSGEIYEAAPFSEAPEHLRRLNDIALSGDGEPTSSAHFERASEVVVEVKEELRLRGVKIVLITNSSLLHEERVRRTLARLDEHQLEVWGKLDAGTEQYFRLVNSSSVPFERIVANLLLTAQARPLVIQSLFVRIGDEPPPREEVEAYANQLAEIMARGGEIREVQLHTIARPPRDRRVRALSREELDQLAQQVGEKVDLPLERYYGSGDSLGG